MKRIFNGSGGRKAALILSLCLIFALAVGTTVALLVAHTNAVTNTFKVAESGTHIEEVTKDGVKSSIIVQNTGTATSYVRVKLVCNWVDKDKNVSATPVQAPKITNSDWFEKDGIYYYTKPVAPTGQTSNLLEGNPIKQESAPDGCHLEVTVLAESIQAAPSQAVESAWPAVKVADGSLTSATPTP